MPPLILLIAIALEGYVVLAVELLAIRQLTPYVGNATDTVAIVIAAVLLPLAFGYEAGGRSGLGAGDEFGVRRRLARNLLIAALILGLGLSHPSLVAFFEAVEALGVTQRLVQAAFTRACFWSTALSARPDYSVGRLLRYLRRFAALDGANALLFDAWFVPGLGGVDACAYELFRRSYHRHRHSRASGGARRASSAGEGIGGRRF